MSILITESLHEENTYFIFRPLTEETFLEIKIRIDTMMEKIKASFLLLPNEMEYIRKNFFDAKFEMHESILNFRWFDSQTAEKTYKSEL